MFNPHAGTKHHHVDIIAFIDQGLEGLICVSRGLIASLLLLGKSNRICQHQGQTKSDKVVHDPNSKKVTCDALPGE